MARRRRCKMLRICSLAITMLLLFAHGAAAEPAGPAEVRVVFVRDGVFTSPTDSAWEEIPETNYALRAQQITPPIGGGSVSNVCVRATHDGDEIAFRLQWFDPSADREWEWKLFEMQRPSDFRRESPMWRRLPSWGMRSIPW